MVRPLRAPWGKGMYGIGKLTTLGLIALVLGACSSFETLGGTVGGQANFAAGSDLSHRLSRADREALGAAFLTAMETGEDQPWRGRRAAGAVSPAGWSLANLLPHPDARIALFRSGLNLQQTMETELGLYALTGKANIRSGPGMNYEALEMLPAGTAIEAVGGVVDRDWYLIAVAGAVRGYVHKSLTIKAPGTELELAGGPHRRPLLCREFSQEVVVFSERNEWTGAACNDGTGWRLAAEPPAPVEEEIEDERLKF